MTTRKEKQEQEAMANLFVWSILALFGLLGLVLRSLAYSHIFSGEKLNQSYFVQI